MEKLTATVTKHKDDLRKTVSGLQAMDWRNQDKSVPSAKPRGQVRALRVAGVLNYGYYPDDPIANRSDTKVLRDMMSFKTYIETRKPPGNNAASTGGSDSDATP